jgi:hypothetical protein
LIPAAKLAAITMATISLLEKDTLDSDANRFVKGFRGKPLHPHVWRRAGQRAPAVRLIKGFRGKPLYPHVW